MDTGTSLFWIAFIAAIGFGIYKIHQKKKWKLVLKIVAVIAVVSIVVGVSIYAYNLYTNRPQETKVLGKVSLGMSTVDVTLALGKPSAELVDADGKKRFVYSTYSEAIEYFIRFDGDSVDLVCSNSYAYKVFGLGVYNSEENIIKRLGMPTGESIAKDGLSKYISYDKYKVAFRISKGDVDGVCVSQSGKVQFLDEYSAAQ